jgi:plasmid segregation protein ParM
MNSSFGTNDFHVKWNEDYYFCGGLIRQNLKGIMEGHDVTKDDDFFILSILLSTFLYGYEESYITSSVPIKEYNEESKQAIIEKLKGTHTLIVNGLEREFIIKEAEIYPETASAFWVNQPRKKTRWIDIGSRTVGYATTDVDDEDNVHFIENESGTIDKMGLEAHQVTNHKAYARIISSTLNKIWGRNDDIKLIGGGGLDAEMVNAFKSIYPNLSLHDDPQHAQARGLLELADMIYGEV